MKGCRVLTKDEITQLLEAAPTQRERMLVLTGLYFGTRISESLGLKFGDFADGDYVRIRRNKKSDFSYLLIPKEYLNELKELWCHYEDRGWAVTDETPLFLSQKGGAMTRQQAARLIHHLKDAAGLTGKISGHSFRKSYATKIYELTGKDVFETIRYTGHKGAGNLIYYIQTTEKQDLTAQLSWGI